MIRSRRVVRRYLPARHPRAHDGTTTTFGSDCVHDTTDSDDDDDEVTEISALSARFSDGGSAILEQGL